MSMLASIHMNAVSLLESVGGTSRLVAWLLGALAIHAIARVLFSLSVESIDPPTKPSQSPSSPEKRESLTDETSTAADLDATYHTLAQQRVSALPSVRFLRQLVQDATGKDDQHKPAYEELLARQMMLDGLPAEQVNGHLVLTSLYGHGQLAAPATFRIRLAEALSYQPTDPGFVHSAPFSETAFTHVSFYHLGARLCGHHRVVHGGLLATVIDEAFGVQAWFEFGAAFTAQLTVDYRKPVLAGQVVRVRTWTEQRTGRKAWLRAVMEAIESPEPVDLAGAAAKSADLTATHDLATAGQVLVEARALFVIPSNGISKAVEAVSSSPSRPASPAVQ